MMASPISKNNIHAFAFAALLALATALGGCETTGGGPSAQAAAPAVPVTHQQASLDCWMATEKDAVRLGLDKRADVVSKCIVDVMDGKPTAAAVADSEGKPKAAASAKPSAKPKADAKPDGKPKS
jgi:hypothetical protein